MKGRYGHNALPAVYGICTLIKLLISLTAENGALRGVPVERGVPKTACRLRSGGKLSPLESLERQSKQHY